MLDIAPVERLLTNRSGWGFATLGLDVQRMSDFELHHRSSCKLSSCERLSAP
jgi:hypothetical protein